MGSKRNKIKKALSPTATVHVPSIDNSPVPAPAPDEDDALMDELLAQLDSKDSTVQTESANVLEEMALNKAADMPPPSESKQDSKSRHKARQARKAAALAQQYAEDNAEEDARIEAETKAEETDIKRICDELGLEMHEITPDGHCLFTAVADQLHLLNVLAASQATPQMTRAAAANYMLSHPDDFLPFLPSENGIMSEEEFKKYCKDIAETSVWGGEPEILALARAYRTPIHVAQAGSPPVVVHRPRGEPGENDVTDDKKVVRISYHRRMYGLGEHYNSLRHKTKTTKIADAIDSVIGR